MCCLCIWLNNDAHTNGVKKLRYECFLNTNFIRTSAIVIFPKRLDSNRLLYLLHYKIKLERTIKIMQTKTLIVETKKQWYVILSSCHINVPTDFFIFNGYISFVSSRKPNWFHVCVLLIHPLRDYRRFRELLHVL